MVRSDWWSQRHVRHLAQRGQSSWIVLILVMVAGSIGFLLSQRLKPAIALEELTSDQIRQSSVTWNLNGRGTVTSFSVSINPGPATPRVDTGVKHADGSAVTVSCSTCHTTRIPNTENQESSDLREFHQSVTVSHGRISCLSCHNDQNYDQLKLADGSPVEFPDVMTLCAQCHGPQMTDYSHGVHGGMNGHWDLTRGPRQKNNCVDCHHPHRPQFPTMRPTFKPRDRFLEPLVPLEQVHE